MRTAFAKYYQGDDADVRLIIGGILASGAGQDVDLIEADAAAFVLEQGQALLGAGRCLERAGRFAHAVDRFRKARGIFGRLGATRLEGEAVAGLQRLG